MTSCGIPNGSNGSKRRYALSPVEALFDEVERAFTGWPAAVAGAVQKGSFPVNILEADGEFILEAELPGLTSEEVDIALDGDNLTVTVNQSARELKGKALHRERRALSGTRVFTLPKGSDAESVHAEMKDGILTVTIKKLPEKQLRKIVVNSGERSAQ